MLPLDRWLPWLLMAAAAAVFGHFLALPPLASPEAKLAAALLKFDGTQELLARSLCGGQPLLPGPLPFRQTGVSPGPMLHKKLTGVSVRMQVEALSHDTVRLSLTMPELGADGVYHLLGAEPVPAGSVLRSEGRCVDRKLYWAPVQSTLHGDRIVAARWRGAN